jgi:hypothetical protein
MNRFIKEAYEHVGEGTHAEPVMVAENLVYPQKNGWGCGVWAMRHCFMKWGYNVDPYELAKTAHVGQSGTTDRKFELAAMIMGSKYTMHDQVTAKRAKQTIDSLLMCGQPLVLYVANHKHVIACLHHTRKGYLIFDSGAMLNQPVIQVHGWKWLMNEMKFKDLNNQRFFCIGSVSKPR